MSNNLFIILLIAFFQISSIYITYIFIFKSLGILFRRKLLLFIILVPANIIFVSFFSYLGMIVVGLVLFFGGIVSIGKSRYPIILFSTVYAIFSNALIGYLFPVFYVAFTKNEDPTMLVFLISAILPGIINLLLLALLNKVNPFFLSDFFSDAKKRNIMIINITLLLSVITMYTFFYAESINSNIDYKNYFILVLVLIFISVLLFMNIHHVRNRKKMLNDIQEDQLQQLKDYAIQIENLYDDIKGFRHDYINILLSLEHSIESGDIESIKSIFHKTIKPTKLQMTTNDYSFIKLKNLKVSEVKSVISSKIMKAQQQHIDVILELEEVIDQIYLPLVDFCRVISILLDNSIEAASDNETPKISFTILNNDNDQCFIIENNFSEHATINLTEIAEKGYTTKGINRGLGLFNVNHILNKHPYTSLETTMDEHTFSQKLMIKKEVIHA